ncbi:hypothetical protein ONR75_15940 [Rhodopseudomonas sp. P2A-2r]|uniref:DUF7940 domain-containing protein n=1 Tax=Rhodopseudomonas sp. P2A-2r TaxID=2991972 RepID=UPI0022340E57|nr:hypothetical protein [Rhodopseudomonas sp. P2A-2r]UZE51922.1 hypothetical protein ONR75_15940 [Rhodopseudomonas sp. P2A-2r]
MKLRLIENAWRDLHRLWSIRISIAYGVFMGINCVLAAFFDVFNPWFLLAVAVFVNIVLIPLARSIKQADPETAE